MAQATLEAAPGEWVTAHRAGMLTGIAKASIRRWSVEGKIPSRQVDGRPCVRVADCLAYGSTINKVVHGYDGYVPVPKQDLAEIGHITPEMRERRRHLRQECHECQTLDCETYTCMDGHTDPQAAPEDRYGYCVDFYRPEEV